MNAEWKGKTNQIIKLKIIKSMTVHFQCCYCYVTAELNNKREVHFYVLFTYMTII